MPTFGVKKNRRQFAGGQKLWLLNGPKTGPPKGQTVQKLDIQPSHRKTSPAATAATVKGKPRIRSVAFANLDCVHLAPAMRVL